MKMPKVSVPTFKLPRPVKWMAGIAVTALALNYAFSHHSDQKNKLDPKHKHKLLHYPRNFHSKYDQMILDLDSSRMTKDKDHPNMHITQKFKDSLETVLKNVESFENVASGYENTLGTVGGSASKSYTKRAFNDKKFATMEFHSETKSEDGVESHFEQITFLNNNGDIVISERSNTATMDTVRLAYRIPKGQQ